MPPDTVNKLADSLAGTFPGCEDAPLSLALLRELARGEPVAPASLDKRAQATLARWPNVDHDDAGRIVAFGGLSLNPTAHRFIVGNRQLYTWCAWDTLFLPAMLRQPAQVQSRCPITGSAVRLTVEPDAIRNFDPEPLWVSFPPAAMTSTADITGTFCCHVHFLATPAAGEKWLSQHRDGTVLELADAYELGRKATRGCTD